MTRRYALAIAAIAVAAIALLAPALGGPFLWDDVHLIPNNATIQGLDRWTHWFRTALFGEPAGTAEAVRYWRPLALLSFALEWHLVGNNPALYHATNLFLYLILILGVGLTLHRYTPNPAAATLGTLLFALHPTHAECAAWISGRMDLLVSIGILGCCWSLGLRLRRNRRGLLWAELAFAAVAYMSKETALLLPAFCLVEAWMALDQPLLSRPVLGRLCLAVTPQFSIALFYGVTRWLWFPFGKLPGGAQPSIDLDQRLKVFAETLGRDAALSFWPHPQRAQHGLVSLNASGRLAIHGTYVAIGVVVVVALICALVLLRRHLLPSFAIALGVLSLLPASNLLLPWLLSCFTFERYLLLSHVAGAWCIAIVMDTLGHCRRWQRLHVPLYALGGSIAVIFGWRLQCRAADYADADRFWRHELQANPESAIAPWSLSSLAAEPIVSLGWLRLCHHNASKRGQYRDADDCLISATETTLNLLLDAQVDELERLGRIFSTFLREDSSQERPPSAPVVHGITLSLPRDLARRNLILGSYPGRIEADLALLHSRLGQHRAASQYAEVSLARCRRCRWSAPLSTVFAAAGEHQRAAAVLNGWDDRAPDVARVRQQVNGAAEFHRRAQATTGAQRLHDQAQSLLSIGRFGLALSTLEPAEAAIIEAPEAAHDYALIAHRAGHFDVARRVLLRYHQKDRVDEILRTWSKDRPHLD